MIEISQSNLWCFIIVLCLLLKLLWKRRWLYYYSWILPGPLSLPIIGSPAFVFAGQEGLLETMFKLAERYFSAFRFWIGPHMFIVTSKAKEVEYLLTNCLQKENIMFYSRFDEFTSSLFTTSFHKWQPRRKNLNRGFNQTILNSYVGIQVKVANKTLKELEMQCGESKDLFMTLWTTTFDMVLETIGAVDVTTLSERTSEVIPILLRLEKLFLQRIFNPLYYFDWIWKKSSEHKAVTDLKEISMHLIREVILRYQKSSSCVSADDDESKNKHDFLGRALKGEYKTQELEEEVTFFFIAGSESSATVIGSVLLVMSIYPEVQIKLFEEQKTISNDRELTLEDLNSFDYLERVIKETMRLVPPAPLIARYMDKTIKIDNQVYPEGSMVFIPIQFIHRKPEYWSNPLKFDPDRFLPKEVEQRPRCAYLPFSFGPRNCIGSTYAMMSMKIVLSKIIKNFEVLSGQYKSLVEVEMTFSLPQKSKNGYQVLLRKR